MQQPVFQPKRCLRPLDHRLRTRHIQHILVDRVNKKPHDNMQCAADAAISRCATCGLSTEWGTKWQGSIQAPPWVSPRVWEGRIEVTGWTNECQPCSGENPRNNLLPR